jgi:hypothetical protein
VQKDNLPVAAPCCCKLFRTVSSHSDDYHRIFVILAQLHQTFHSLQKNQDNKESESEVQNEDDNNDHDNDGKEEGEDDEDDEDDEDEDQNRGPNMWILFNVPVRKAVQEEDGSEDGSKSKRKSKNKDEDHSFFILVDADMTEEELDDEINNEDGSWGMFSSMISRQIQRYNKIHSTNWQDYLSPSLEDSFEEKTVDPAQMKKDYALFISLV